MKYPLLPVFEKGNTIHLPTYYYLKTKVIASIRTYYRIDVASLFKKILSQFEIDERNVIKLQSYVHHFGHIKTSVSYIEISKTIHLCLNLTQSFVELYFSSITPEEELEKVQSIIIEFFKKATVDKKVGLIVTSSSGDLEVREFVIADQENDITSLYNDDFLNFHEMVTAKLSGQKAGGILLLHGVPGTGKSSYIRHLIGTIPKKFIYLPSSLANQMSQPSFLHFLAYHADSVLIIEDAEDLLMKRKTDSKPAISNLLNLSDGLLSDCLKIQVIATFNCEHQKIDEAFLRKGRIMGRYCFEPLATTKANALLKKLNFSHETDKEITLAEIFHFNEADYSSKKHAVQLGFINEKVN